MMYTRAAVPKTTIRTPEESARERARDFPKFPSANDVHGFLFPSTFQGVFPHYAPGQCFSICRFARTSTNNKQPHSLRAPRGCLCPSRVGPGRRRSYGHHRPPPSLRFVHYSVLDDSLDMSCARAHHGARPRPAPPRPARLWTHLTARRRDTGRPPSIRRSSTGERTSAGIDGPIQTGGEGGRSLRGRGELPPLPIATAPLFHPPPLPLLIGSEKQEKKYFLTFSHVTSHLITVSLSSLSPKSPNSAASAAPLSLSPAVAVPPLCSISQWLRRSPLFRPNNPSTTAPRPS
jgi:hypothetical protein